MLLRRARQPRQRFQLTYWDALAEPARGMQDCCRARGKSPVRRLALICARTSQAQEGVSLGTCTRSLCAPLSSNRVVAGAFLGICTFYNADSQQRHIYLQTPGANMGTKKCWSCTRLPAAAHGGEKSLPAHVAALFIPRVSPTPCLILNELDLSSNSLSTFLICTFNAIHMPRILQSLSSTLPTPFLSGSPHSQRLPSALPCV